MFRPLSSINCKIKEVCFLSGNSNGRILCLGFDGMLPRNGLSGVKAHDADHGNDDQRALENNQIPSM